MAEQLSGIANYCFRWCERCPFTDRCGVFELGRQMGAEDPKQHALPRSFPAVSGSYRDYMARLDRQLAPEHESVESLQRRTPPTVDEMNKRAKLLVLNHLRGSDWMLPLTRSADFSQPAVQAAHLFNYYTVVLGPKLQRALRSHEHSGQERDDFYYADARHTAYLVLLMLARTTAAGVVLLESSAAPRPLLLDHVRDFLDFSEGLRRLFPDVALFPRPYWDQEPWIAEQRTYYNGHPPLHPFREGLWSFGGDRAPRDV